MKNQLYFRGIADRLRQRTDIADIFLHQCHALPGLFVSMLGAVGGLTGILRHTVYRADHFRHRRGDLVNFILLTAHALMGTARLFGHQRHLRGHITDRTDQFRYLSAQTGSKTIKGGGHLLNFGNTLHA